MNIAIAGASDIGFHLAKLLSFEAQDITLIDADKELLSLSLIHISEPTRPC